MSSPSIEDVRWNNNNPCSALDTTCAGCHISKTGNRSWILIYCRHKITSKDYLRKLPQKIKRVDYTIAVAKWWMSYLHFLHFPFTKTTLQSAHAGRNGWNVSKCTLLLMMWRMQQARERCYYTPLVKKSATYSKLFPIKEKRKTMRRPSLLWMVIFSQSKQDIRNLHVQKCYSEFRWIARFLLHTAEASGSSMRVRPRRRRNQVAHSRVLFIFTLTATCYTGRHESQGITRLWTWTRNVWRAS